ncbi:hypothetical protein [Microtetraspora malaysiensis]|uniref:hypothetical protein n=1 Tax=Microtetraspora malaysiensis TaxID=161358 RepID=UPI003D909E31
MIFTLFAVYAVTAAPEFLPGEWRLIVQPATSDAVEVFLQPISPVMLRSYEGIGPYQRALEAAERRAAAHPRDLAPPYILHEPYRLVAPYVTAQGRELAAPPISGADWPDGKYVPYRVVPQGRQVKNSQAELTALAEMEGGPIEEPEVLSVGIEPELNRVILGANTFDQDLRHRLAKRYGGLVAIKWEPFQEWTVRYYAKKAVKVELPARRLPGPAARVTR